MGLFKWISRQVNKVVSFVSNVVTKTVNAISNTVAAIIKNPLPVLAQIAGSAVGIPPYVTSAAITALQGGKLSDIAKSAALSYAGSQISGQIGSSSIGSATASAGQSVTQSLMDSYPSLATAAGNAVTAGLNAGIVGAGSAALMGKDIGQGAIQGFTSGSTGSLASSYFKSVQPDWGISDKTVKTLSGLTGTVAAAELLGQNSQVAASNYLANTAVQTALDTAKDTAKDAYATAKDYFTKSQEAAATADAEVQKAYEIQKTFDIAKASHDAAVADYQKKADEFNAARDKYQKQVDIYNDSMKGYNTTNAEVAVRNMMLTQAEAAAKQANLLYPSLMAQKAQIDELQKNLSDPLYAVNKQYLDASTAYTNQIDIVKKASEEAKAIQEQADKAVTDYQSANTAFEEAQTIYQKELEKATDAQTTNEDEVNQFFQEKLGRDATPEEVAAYTGDKPEASTLNDDLVQRLQEEKFAAEEEARIKTEEEAARLAEEQKAQEEAAQAAKLKEAGIYIDENGTEQWIDDTVDYDDSNYKWDGSFQLPEEIAAPTNPTVPIETNFLDESGDVNYDDTNYNWDGSIQLPDESGIPTTATPGQVSPDENTLTEVVVTPDEGETFIDENGVEQWVPAPTAAQPTPANPTKPTTTPASPLTPQPTAQPTAKPQYVAPVVGALQTVAQEAPAPLKPTGLTASGLTTKGQQEAFIDPLAPLQQVMAQSDLISNNRPQTFPVANQNQLQNNLLPQLEEQPDMLEPFYNYGSNQSIDDIMGGGGQSSFAEGGLAGTRYGKYAAGGMPTPLMAAGGKMRVDFRHGDAVTGAGDGQSDDIPAMLADGEFVFPADVVAAIGNGSTKAGSDKLYDMMHGIRAHVRSAAPKDLPPVIKSPLDFLKPKKARR